MRMDCDHLWVRTKYWVEFSRIWISSIGLYVQHVSSFILHENNFGKKLTLFLLWRMDFDPFVSRGLQFREYDVALEGNSATATIREKGVCDSVLPCVCNTSLCWQIRLIGDQSMHVSNMSYLAMSRQRHENNGANACQRGCAKLSESLPCMRIEACKKWPSSESPVRHAGYESLVLTGL